MTKKIALLGAALGWGAQNCDTEYGPQALQQFGLEDHLTQAGLDCYWHDILSPKVSLEKAGLVPHLERLEWIIELNEKIASTVHDIVGKDYLPVILGGDHSIAMGTWSGLIDALNCKENFGLIWFDAHMDANTPETSPSHAVHGMPVAHLLGAGIEKLVNLQSAGAKLKPEHLVLIGIRSYESGEAALLNKMGVRIYDMQEIERKGLGVVCQEALEIVTRAKGGFGVSIDLDGFDPKDAPGVGSPETNGLCAQEFLSHFDSLTQHAQFKALEIAEYNPKLDKDHMTAKLTEDIIKKLK